MILTDAIFGRKASEVGALEMGGVVGYPMADPATFAGATNELSDVDITVEQINATDLRMFFTKDWSFTAGQHFSSTPVTHFHDYSLRCKGLGDNLFKQVQSLLSLKANGATHMSRSLLQQQHNCSVLELEEMETFSVYAFYDARALTSVSLPSAVDLDGISNAFRNMDLCEEILLPECTILGGSSVFSGSNVLANLYLPKLQSMPSNPFGGIYGGCTITLPVYFATSDNGSEDPYVAYARDRGCTIIYV